MAQGPPEFPEDTDSIPEVTTSFTIYGRFDPDEVTRIMGLAPSRQARKGQRIRTAHSTVPIEDSWSLQSEAVRTREGSEEVARTIRRLKPLATSLQRVRARFPQVGMDLTLVAYIPAHPHSAVPNLSLSTELIHDLADLGIDFTIDFMLLGPESP